MKKENDIEQCCIFNKLALLIHGEISTNNEEQQVFRTFCIRKIMCCQIKHCAYVQVVSCRASFQTTLSYFLTLPELLQPLTVFCLEKFLQVTVHSLQLYLKFTANISSITEN